MWWGLETALRGQRTGAREEAEAHAVGKCAHGARARPCGTADWHSGGAGTKEQSGRRAGPDQDILRPPSSRMPGGGGRERERRAGQMTSRRLGRTQPRREGTRPPGPAETTTRGTLSVRKGWKQVVSHCGTRTPPTRTRSPGDSGERAPVPGRLPLSPSAFAAETTRGLEGQGPTVPSATTVGSTASKRGRTQLARRGARVAASRAP